jgi:hypothetical protein
MPKTSSKKPVTKTRKSVVRPITKLQVEEPLHDNPFIEKALKAEVEPEKAIEKVLDQVIIVGKEYGRDPMKATAKDPDYDLRWVAQKNITKRKGQYWELASPSDIYEDHFMEHADGSVRYQSLRLFKRHKDIGEAFKRRLEDKNKKQEQALVSNNSMLKPDKIS